MTASDPAPSRLATAGTPDPELAVTQVREASRAVHEAHRAWQRALDARDAVVRTHRPVVAQLGHAAFARRVGDDLISAGTVRAIVGPISRTAG